MPVCARALQLGDGSWVLALDPAETNPATCAYVVQTGGESGFFSLFELSPSDAASIAGAIAAVWALAWGIRLLGKFIMHEERNQDE